MSETPRSDDAAGSAEPAPDGSAVVPAADAAPPSRPGLSTFTIEGRAAPGLFVVGWLTTLLGMGMLLIGVLSASIAFLYFVAPAFLSIGLVTAAGSQAIERRARGADYAGPSPLLVLAAVVAVTYLAGAVLGVGLDLVLGALGVELEAYVVRLIAVVLQAIVFLGVLRLVVVGTGALSWRDMGWTRPGPRALSDLASGAVFAVPVIAVSLVVGLILVDLFDVISPSPLPRTGVLAGMLVQLLAGALIAPIAEEALFRGFATTAWELTDGWRAAILRSSILFAVAHVITISAGSLPEAVGLIAVGAGTRLPVAFVLGWLFVRRRSIWAPIGLHVAFNGVLLVLSELAPPPIA